MNKKAIKKLLSYILSLLMLTTTITPAFAEVTHYVVSKDGVKYQYAQEDLITSYYGDEKLYNDYLSGDLVALLDDQTGYIAAGDVFKYIASTEEVNVNAYTESQAAKAIEVGELVKLDANGNPMDGQSDAKYIASDFNYAYMQYKPVMQSEKEIFAISGFTAQGLEKSKVNGNLLIPKVVEIEENGTKVTKSVEGIDREAFKGQVLESVIFPETKGEYDFVINASAFADTGLKSVTFNEGIRAIKESAFTNNNLSKVYLPSTTLTIGSKAFSSNKIYDLEFSDDVKAIQIDNYAFYDNQLEEVHLPYSIFKFLAYVFKGNPGTEALSDSELDANDPTGTGVVKLYTRNPDHLTSDTYIARSKYYNIINVAEGVDRSALYAKIQEAESLVLSDYPEKSVANLVAKLLDVKSVFKEEAATQKDIDHSNTMLTEAIVSLKAAGIDKSDLRDLIKEAKGYSSKVYTKESYDLLISALKNGEFLLKDLTAQDKDVEAAEGQIRDAIATLIARPDLVFAKEDFTYEGNTITGLSSLGEEKSKYNKNLVLPNESLEGIVIEVIGASAFENTEADIGSDVVTPIDGFETIEFPSQLKRIEKLAFKYNCLEELEFPETLEYIGDLAFNGNLLKSVRLPDSVVELGSGTFSLNRITEVHLSQNLTEISNGTFSRNIYLDHVELHEGLTRIGQSAFIGCPLKTIEFPYTLKTIGRLAFSSSRLQSVHIPSSVDVIEKEAFKQNTKFRTLKEVTFEDGLKSIGKNAFMDGMISEVTLPYSLESLSDTAFKGNINVNKEEIIVKLYTSNANHLAFETEESKAYQEIIFSLPESPASDFVMDENGVITAYNGTATQVIIPSEIDGNAVLAIGDKTFYRKGIIAVKIPDTVTRIGEKAFYGNGLSSIDLPAQLVTIETQAFKGNDLQALVVPSSVEMIGSGAFSGNKIVSLSLPEGLKVMENGAFLSNALTEVSIPGSLEVVSAYAFAMNPNLENIALEEGIKEISMNAFTKNGALTGEVMLPSSLEHVYGSSFKGTGVTGYYIKGDKDSALLQVHSTTATHLEALRFELPDKRAHIVFNASGDAVTEFVVDLGVLDCTEGVDNLQQYLEEKLSIKESAYHVNTKDSTGKSDIMILTDIDWDLEQVTFIDGRAVVFGSAKDFTSEDLASKGADYTPPNTSGTTAENRYKLTITLKEDQESDFEINENGVITAYKGTNLNVVIPAEIDGISAKAIGPKVFLGKGIQSVEIPKGIERIGLGSFIKNKLTSVTLPSSVKTIEAMAFANNKELVEINLNEGLETIEKQVFQMTPLQDATIVIPSTVTFVGNSAFYSQNIDKMIIKGDENSSAIQFGYPIGGNGLNIELESPKKNVAFLWNSFGCGDVDNTVDLGTIEVAAKTKEELKSALEQEVNVKIVGIYETETSAVEDIRLAHAIPWDLSQIDLTQDTIVLTQKIKLENDQFPEKEGYIAPTPSECTANNYYKITVKLIETSDFEIDANGVITAYTASATDVVIPDELEGRSVLAIGEKVFYRKGITSIQMPDTITTIGEKAFYGNRLSSIDLPAQLVTIETQAFKGNDLQALVVPSSVEMIGTGAFSGNKIASLILPKSLKVMENGAFLSNALTEVSIPGSLEVVSAYAFAMNPNLKNLVLEEGIKEISMNAFTKNGALTGEVTLPSSLEHIYSSSFKGTGVTAYYVKGDKDSASLQVHSTTATTLQGLRFESPDKNAYVVFNAAGDEVREFVVDLGRLDCTEVTENLEAYLENSLFVKESAYHVNNKDSSGKSDIMVLADINWDFDHANVTTGAAVVFGTAKDFTAEDLESKGEDFTPPNTAGIDVINTYKITLLISAEKDIASLVPSNDKE